MKVLVKRTSAGDCDQPCDGAEKVTYHDEYGPSFWWQIEIGTLDDLLAMVGRYGKIIVDESFGTRLREAGVLWEVEIYDKYRE